MASSSSSFPIPTSMDIPQELARHLFEQGATLIFLEFPESAEFGVDYKSWTVGEKFKGLKMIPPGVHFIYYSCGRAPRIGFFHDFKPQEVLVKKWDKQTEDLSMETVDEEEISRFRSNLQSMDPFLGPYPFDTYRSWFALSSHMTGPLVEQLCPLSGRITSQAELVTMETELMEAATSEVARNSNTVDRQHPTRLRFADSQGLPIMRIRPGYDLRFHAIPERQQLSASERAGMVMDASAQLERLLTEFSDEKQLLGELQFAFVCFLMGQIYESFEHWKRLVRLLCSCHEALVSRRQLFMDFLMTLHFQLKECPEDFFVDIVSRNNFLTITLANFFSNVDTTEGVDPVLREKARKFKSYLTKRFKWDFEQDDGPTIVSMD
uniref:Protein AAR2 homolog n=1 Tax=Plectus sambesii TaxID=2011161 RepID=A0A914V7U3_9BILA